VHTSLFCDRLLQRPSSPAEEASDLKSLQGGFESHLGHFSSTPSDSPMRQELEEHLGRFVTGRGHVVSVRKPNFVASFKHQKFICFKKVSLNFVDFSAPHSAEYKDIKAIDHLWIEGTTVTVEGSRAALDDPEMYRQVVFAGKITKYERKDSSFDYGIQGGSVTNGVMINQMINNILKGKQSRLEGLRAVNDFLSDLIHKSDAQKLDGLAFYFCDAECSHNEIRKDIKKVQAYYSQQLSKLENKVKSEVKAFYDLIGNPKSLSAFIGADSVSKI
jgi:hypothetical protein